MEATMAIKKSLVIWTFILTGLATFFEVVPVLADQSPVGHFSMGPHRENMRKMQAFKASLIRHDSVSLAPSPSSAPQPPEVTVLKPGLLNFLCSLRTSVWIFICCYNMRYAGYWQRTCVPRNILRRWSDGENGQHGGASSGLICCIARTEWRVLDGGNH